MGSIYTETFTEQARTVNECRAKIQQKYGDRAVILNRKHIRQGGFLGLGAREVVEMTGYIPPGHTKANPWGRDYPVTVTNPEKKQVQDFEEEKKKVLAAANRGDPTLQRVLNEVVSLREKIERQESGTRENAHPSIVRMEGILGRNDFSASYTAALLDRMKKECSLEELDNFDLVQGKVLEWIGESIKIHREEDRFIQKPRIIVLVGPTGVGKTSTIAKIATTLGIDKMGNHIRKMVLVTIDAYRIAAKPQLDTYGQILESPVFFAAEYDELRKIIALNSTGVDLILIDTIGRSPRDSEEIGAMRDVLEACGSLAEIYLTVSATTKTRDLLEIIQRFEPFNCRSLIVTKMDETMQAGNVISALADKSKSVAYITYGQTPVDIAATEVIEFLTRLEGFPVNRRRLEERFGGGSK